jgi:hypothetical protein
MTRSSHVCRFPTRPRDTRVSPSARGARTGRFLHGVRAFRALSTSGVLALCLIATSARADETQPGGVVAPEPPGPSAPPAPSAPASTLFAAPHFVAPPPAPAAPPREPVYFVDDDAAEKIPFREGTSVPPGFRLDSSPRVALVATGASVSGALWLISTVTAIGLDKQTPVAGDPNFDDMYWPMFIPVIGPFIAIGTADSSGTGAGILALDGALQAGGLAMMIAGFVAPKLQLVPQKGIYLNGQAAPGLGGLSVGGEF